MLLKYGPISSDNLLVIAFNMKFHFLWPYKYFILCPMVLLSECFGGETPSAVVFREWALFSFGCSAVDWIWPPVEGKPWWHSEVGMMETSWKHHGKSWTTHDSWNFMRMRKKQYEPMHCFAWFPPWQDRSGNKLYILSGIKSECILRN